MRRAERCGDPRAPGLGLAAERYVGAPLSPAFVSELPGSLFVVPTC